MRKQTTYSAGLFDTTGLVQGYTVSSLKFIVHTQMANGGLVDDDVDDTDALVQWCSMPCPLSRVTLVSSFIMS